MLAFLAVERWTIAGEHFDDRERWYAREKELREQMAAREKELQTQNAELLNRLLYRHAVEPISLKEHEQTLKLPDIETPPLTPIDEAMFVDDVLEEIEFHHPQFIGWSAEHVRQEKPELWRQMEKAVRDRTAPLVIG